jgi:cob(I)alamin adenosyltransferase
MAEGFKIYTKTGDEGETSLIGGTRVPKYHQRIEAYGTLDELKSFTGYLYDQVEDAGSGEMLKAIIEILFRIEAQLATDPNIKLDRDLPKIDPGDVEMLEKEIDKMNAVLPTLKSFILPIGHKTSSLAHVCRTVCRRAERLVIKLSQNSRVDGIILSYLNRLSDYFFVLARFLAHINGSSDVPWSSSKE